MREFIWPPVANPARDAMHKALARAWALEYADPLYKYHFEKAKDGTKKAAIAREYLENAPESAAKSEWYKTAAGLLPLLGKAKHPKVRRDATKEIIANIKRDNPKITQLQLCSKLDALDIPVVKSWQRRRRDRMAWCQVYRDSDLRKLLAPYLSKIHPST